ncbi:MAG: hypothetical protein Q4G22_08560 [Paracoccus sp. (in: a-proteobacteria)]|uniref:hypothetical protein n=1 Tax=Paracoccus sp. TaxID=267 RepID=UPI0026DFD9A2|nr:hypothetical protein [Paracoccus sp. (in: a-proteobacteria)]MDO5631875.1 hypothetical protein [Paracoccus sp. (in: a-proteobacteria)]
MTDQDPKQPVLWLGAHKTGTTFLQRALEQSDTVLQAAGYHYMPLTAFRDRYTRPLLYDGEHGTPDAPPVPGLSLIFDENIPGLVQDALSRDGLYPQAAERSHKMAEYLSLHNPDIWFGVRDYVSFLPSLFCETLKSTPYKPFGRFYDPKRHPLNWNVLIDRLRLAFPQSRIRIYQNEALRGREAALLSAVTGIAAAAFTIPRGTERPGFSHKAVRSLYDLSKTRTVERCDVFAAVRQYPKGPEWPAFDPLNDQRKQELSAAYQAHLQRLRDRDDVDFIDLGAA